MELESVRAGRVQHAGGGGVSSGTGWIEEEGVVAIWHAPPSAYECFLRTVVTQTEPPKQLTKRIIALLAGMHVGCRLQCKHDFCLSFLIRSRRRRRQYEQNGNMKRNPKFPHCQHLSTQVPLFSLSRTSISTTFQARMKSRSPR